MIFIISIIALSGCSTTQQVQTNQNPQNAVSNNADKPGSAADQKPFYEMSEWEKSDWKTFGGENFMEKYGGKCLVGGVYQGDLPFVDPNNCWEITEESRLTAYYSKKPRPAPYVYVTVHKTSFIDKENLQLWLDVMRKRFPAEFKQISPNRYYVTSADWGEAIKVYEQNDEILYTATADDLSSGLADCGTKDLEFCKDIAFEVINQAKG